MTRAATKERPAKWYDHKPDAEKDRQAVRDYLKWRFDDQFEGEH